MVHSTAGNTPLKRCKILSLGGAIDKHDAFFFADEGSAPESDTGNGGNNNINNSNSSTNNNGEDNVVKSEPDSVDTADNLTVLQPLQTVALGGLPAYGQYQGNYLHRLENKSLCIPSV